ncbi:LysR family transcriptional regulator [Cohaesibacter gelatinilyticus]|nr:LysR family transcriptional regulator [Cohaesibacter gelatinilyticus]
MGAKVIRMNWNDLKFFLAVARAKSLSESARKLGVSTSTVSRRIVVLEADLQSNLFRHHHDGYELTLAGVELLEPAEKAEAQMRLLERSALRQEGHLSGLVRVDLPELLGQKIILPGLQDFFDDYPDIRMDFRSSVLPVRLRSQESDIVLRLVRPEKGNYRIRQVGRVDFGLFASKAYIERHGEPAKAQDLAAHRIIGWPEDLNFLTMSAWLQSISAEFYPSLFLDSLTAHLEAARHGYGIAVLPTFAARPEGLHPILRDVPPLKMDLWLLLHDQSPTSPRVRAVYEKLIDILARNKGVLQE